ncbi:hypothetical protein JYK02_16410 [Corallococcus macrosporus]|uniref:Flp family type IVb pilin n=1 Tax=Corallococcus macrosporus TaxID=35 RepID=A0ABS3DDN2_9BACT|nr:hypothetical protein [Corallococcus macrosporus]MBN8229096.1 hypothetical protein [Corallococcus macrosporus]
MKTRTSLKQALQRGQAMSEYGVITAAFFGFTVLSWPFLVQLLRALSTYFQSIYYVIQSPIP